MVDQRVAGVPPQHLLGGPGRGGVRQLEIDESHGPSLPVPAQVLPPGGVGSGRPDRFRSRSGCATMVR